MNVFLHFTVFCFCVQHYNIWHRLLSSLPFLTILTLSAWKLLWTKSLWIRGFKFESWRELTTVIVFNFAYFFICVHTYCQHNWFCISIISLLATHWSKLEKPHLGKLSTQRSFSIVPLSNLSKIPFHNFIEPFSIIDC